MTARPHDPLHWIDQELEALADRDLRRQRSAYQREPGGVLTGTAAVESARWLDFGSNDYLGLAHDPRVAAAAAEVGSQGWGATASPLVCGRSRWHAELEERLAQFEGTEAAIVFPSGFAANLGTIAALVARGDAVFSDEKNHASIIDGCRLSRAEVFVYPHADVDALQSQLARAAHFRRRLIVTDALFSMDGNFAPLAELAELAERYDAMLLVDEAHATGVWGQRGRGVAEHLGVAARVPVKIGTLSKALGSMGGFVCGSRSLIEWLANRARPYIFSTALPPAAAVAAWAALDLVEREPQRRHELARRASWLRDQLAAQGWNVGASSTQIVPLVVGAAATALELSARLREAGLFVPAIRPPSVAEGQARLRISLTYPSGSEGLERLVAALGRLVPVLR